MKMVTRIKWCIVGDTDLVHSQGNALKVKSAKHFDFH